VLRLKIFVKIRESLCTARDRKTASLSGPGSTRRLEVTTTSPEGGSEQVDIVVGDVGAQFRDASAQFAVCVEAQFWCVIAPLGR
jgi:hypothetical protein